MWQRPVREVRDELTVPQTVTENPFVLQQEANIPELATTIRERGIWPRHRPFTLLGRTDTRIKLGDGSYLNVIGDSSLTDFICHHAWFEGDDVALPREDRVCLLGNFTGQTPKKRQATESRSVAPDVFSSFPVETEQHELEPGLNATGPEPDEMDVDDEDVCDDAANAQIV